MLKIVVLIKRKAGISMAEFVDHYENHHAPLAVRLLPNMKRYFRRYLHPQGRPPASQEIEFDVLTEVWLSDQADLEIFMATLEKHSAVIYADELNFIDQSSIRFTILEEYESDLSRVSFVADP